jgi:hypothetical protein
VSVACSLVSCLVMVQMIEGPAPEIGEEQIQQDRGRVTWLLLQRYEAVWDRVQVRIEEDRDGTRPLDPRFLEIGMRAAKEIGYLYRLNKPLALVEDEEDPAITGVDRAAVVATQLRELEAKQWAAAQAAEERLQRAKEHLQEEA